MTLLEQTLTRREYLKVSAAVGGALVVGFGADPARATAGATPAATALAGWVRIDKSGAVTLLTNATELGQGSPSALAQILAEELELDWNEVRIDMAPVEEAYYGMWGTYQTGGSGSVRGMFDKLRTAGATARTLLLQTAASEWGVSP